jgi:hypothetical protein
LNPDDKVLALRPASARRWITKAAIAHSRRSYKSSLQPPFFSVLSSSFGSLGSVFRNRAARPLAQREFHQRPEAIQPAGPQKRQGYLRLLPAAQSSDSAWYTKLQSAAGTAPGYL